MRKIVLVLVLFALFILTLPDIFTLNSEELTNYAYDGVGNLISLQDAKGNTTSYTYDANNRLLKVVPGEVQQ